VSNRVSMSKYRANECRARSTVATYSGRTVLLLLLLAPQLGCRKRPPPPSPEENQAPSAAKAPARSAPSHDLANSGPASSPSTESVADQRQTTQQLDTDPLGGHFTLAQATKGLGTKGRLVADLVTDAGTLSCELYEDRAPVTVANFVGLARGIRPFKDPTTGRWITRHAYDGTGFHRIIKGYMIQGGDPTGTGTGEPGYNIPDEVWQGARHDRRGLLCMANRGPNTNGMQFFILDAPAPHLDAMGFTVFGNCTPGSVIERLASTPVRGDRAVVPPKIRRVVVERRP